MPNTSISFPASPTAGQTHTYGSTTYTFDGSYWSVNGSSVDQVSTNDIQNGAVTPAKLSTGGPSWTSGGNLTITGDLIVDTNTLFVDATNNRVGVKTISPVANYGLTVLDNIYVGTGSDLSPSGTGLGHISINGSGYIGYLTLDSTAMHIGHNSSSRSITFDTDETSRLTITAAGDVGIGTSSPSTALQVNGIIKNTNPCFHATSAAGLTPSGTIVFTSEQLDSASAYNNTTGIFTAPVTGTYKFDANILGYWGAASPRNVTYWSFRKNNAAYGTTHYTPNATTTAGQYMTVSGSCVMQLNAGQTASVYLNAGEVFANYGAFSGHLIG